VAGGREKSVIWLGRKRGGLLSFFRFKR